MSSSNSNKLTPGIERRLRPIYDLLNSGSYKRAHAETERLLKKKPDCHIAQVIKALTLIRMNRVGEARSTLEQVMSTAQEEGLFVGDTTQILMNCYKELREPQMICRIQESICEQLQTEEAYVQYFMSLVRVEDNRKMNQVAMKLYKTFKNPAYFSWAISSLVLHHIHFKGPLESSVTLSFELAERMIDKFLSELDEDNLMLLGNWNLLDLYIQLMIRYSTNWEKMLGIFKTKGYPLEEPSAWKWDSDHENYCYVMQKAGLKVELLKHLKALFLQHKDYSLLKQIVDLFGKDEETEDEVADFMDEIRMNHASFVVAMANLYYNSQDQKRCTDETQRKDCIVKDLQMAIKFGLEKVNFFPDAVEKFKLVDHQTQLKLIATMTPSSTMAGNMEEVKLNTMSSMEIIKDINYELARRDLMGKTFDLKKRLNQANFCFGKYLGFKAARQNRPVTATTEVIETGATTQDEDKNKEIDYLDQYVLIAASILVSEQFKLEKKFSEKALCQALETMGVVDVGHENDEKDFREELLLSAMCIMEYGLTRSPTNCTLRFLLANAYARFGATEQVLKVMQGINIKHVQLDSLGYLLFPLVLTTGAYPEALLMLRQADLMYSSYESDNVEYIITAYDHCNYRQVSEFCSFRRQLLQSLQCGLILVEKRLLEYMICTHSIDLLKTYPEQILQELKLSELMTISCFDNRDLTVLQNLFDDGMDWNVFRETTEILDALWFRMRLSLMTFLTKMIIIGMNPKAEEAFAIQIDDLQNVMKTWKEHCAKLKKAEIDKPLESPYFGIYPPRHTRHFQLSIPDYLTEQMNCVLTLIMEKAPKSGMEQLKKFDEILGQRARGLLTLFEENVSAFKGDSDFKQKENYIQDFHFILEFFSFSRIFLAVAITTVKTDLVEETKGKSRKKGKVVNDFAFIIKNSLEYFEKLHKLFVELFKFLHVGPLPSWPNSKFTEGAFINSMETNFLSSAFPATYDDVQKNIRDSHLEQISQMTGIAEMLVQFINSM